MYVSDETLRKLYNTDDITQHRQRYEHILEMFIDNFNTSSNLHFFSSPGRVELIGNHSDFNGGCIVAASLTMDSIACSTPNTSDMINIISEGYGKFSVNISNPKAYKDIGSTPGLIAGIVDYFISNNFNVAGFDAFISSEVLPASGISSSASFECLICSIINYFFNNNEISTSEYAKASCYAENEYWNKKSGMMDQLACSVGGIISVDFHDDIEYKKYSYDFSDNGYRLFLVNSGKGHADLNDEFNSIPSEMKDVAGVLYNINVPLNRKNEKCNSDNFDKKVNLSYFTLNQLLDNVHEVRNILKNDRAIMRAVHFLTENIRISKYINALNNNDIDAILYLTDKSGESSWKFLENIFIPTIHDEQPVALNLTLSQLFNDRLADNYNVKAACRVHGGGFLGTMLEIVPDQYAEEYVKYMSNKIDSRMIKEIKIRATGAVHV